jgi:hypothetical protein
MGLRALVGETLLTRRRSIMFKKTFMFGVALVIAVTTVLMTPDTGQAQRYYGGDYGAYQPYYSPYYGHYRPYYGYQQQYPLYYGYGRYNGQYYGGYYNRGYPGYYGTYPRYGYYPNNYLWR